MDKNKQLQLRVFDSADISRLKQSTTDIIDYAQKLGADEIEVGTALSQGLDVNVRLEKLDTLSFNRDKSISVTVYFGKNRGTASTTELTKSSMQAMVEKACEIAKYTAEDQDSGLPKLEELAKESVDLSLHHVWAIDPELAISKAITCESLARLKDKKITNSEGVGLSTTQSAYVYGNSKGFLEGYLGSSHSMNCVLIAQKDDKKERGYWYTTARDPQNLDSLEDLASKSVERTLSRLGACKLSTRECPVIFTAEVASSLIQHFLSAISGGTLYRGASFLCDSLGKSIFAKNIQLLEDPFIKKGFASRYFDNEGVQTKKRILIENGELRGYLLDTYSAKKLNMETTGNSGGAHNILVSQQKNENYSFVELLKEMDTGLLVTGLMGQGVNLITGDYSRGAIGFWVERGEIQYPVEEITIAGGLLDMYKNIIAIGNDIDQRNSILTGSLLLEGMTIAGT